MKKLKALMRLTRRKFKKGVPVVRNAAIAGAGGTVAGYTTGLPGHRGDGAREGALSGALAGGVGTLVFRRIRGRIVPIRRK